MQNETKRKKILLGIGVLLAICLIIGVSYAYWRLVISQTGTNEIASSCFSITLTNEQNAINLQKAYPILDEEGKKLTPYTFTIKNNCDTYASYTINLELLNTVAEDSRLSAEFIKAMIDEETPFLLNTTPATTTLENAYESYTLTTGYLDANEERNYSLRLWMDGSVTIEDDAMNKQLESKITITASYIDHMPTDYERCVEEYGEDSIQCSIIADASDEESGPCPEVNEDGTVSVTDIEDTESLVCSAPDDYGTSYYYRGNVTNNYVKFAGFYWRILRINGDGSIRMIYAGDADVIDALPNKEEVLKNGYNDSSTDYTQIGTSQYNSRSNNNAYVGYMYGENYWGEPTTSESTSSRTLNSYYYYYADSYTFDTSTGTYTLTNPTKAIWNESLVGKYTCRDNEDTSCSTLYYIDSYSSASGGYTLSYTSTNTDGVYTENHGTTTTYRTMADYYYYGTGYTFDKTTGYFALTGTSRSVYDGSQVGTYTCASTWSSCETLYYVESTNDTTTANVRTISRTGTTYDETHANINNSTIKTKVDTWYEENIKDTEYEQYISDTLFCNDRSISEYTPSSSYTNLGYGKEATLKACRQTDLAYPKEHLPVDLYPVKLHLQGSLFLKKGTEHEDGGDKVGYGCGYRNSGHSHVPLQHEVEVQAYICDARKYQIVKRPLGISYRTEYGCAEVIEQDEGKADKVYPQVEDRHVPDLIRRSHQYHQRLRKGYAHENEDEACDYGGPYGSMYHVLDHVLIMPCIELGHQYIDTY